jgi:LuxR family transcriptional regulator, maltose regulon positive regulatory protein
VTSTRERLGDDTIVASADLPVDALTAKERAVLRLLPTSLTSREIAAELYVSLNTVKSHTRTLYRKLAVRNRHAAIEQSRQRNLL